MSIRTEDSLNCPCNGIYKCGLHSVPKFFPNPYTKEEMDKFLELYNERGTPPHFISPAITKDFLQIVHDWWRPQHFAFLEKKEYD